MLQEMIVSEIETRVRGTSLLKRYGTTSLDCLERAGRVLIPRSRFFFTRIPNLVLFSWLSRIPFFVSRQRQFLQKLIKCNL